MTALQGPAAIRHFFHHNHIPLYYVSTSTFNLLGAEAWINNLTFINTINSFDGRHPHIFVPHDAGPRLAGLQQRTIICSTQAVADYVHQRGPNGAVLFLMFDASTERLARHLGLRVCFPLRITPLSG